jgi:hypothetical protein
MQVIGANWFLPDGPDRRDDVGRMLDPVIDGLRYGSTEGTRKNASGADRS